jgi:hypothetical protein
MRMVLRNGFAHPSQAFTSDDDLDAMVDAAAERSVVVQGVRCVRMVAGRLLIEFHDGSAAHEAQLKTHWPNADVHTLQPTLKPRDGGVSVVADGFAYSDYEIDKAA